MGRLGCRSLACGKNCPWDGTSDVAGGIKRERNDWGRVEAGRIPAGHDRIMLVVSCLSASCSALQANLGWVQEKGSLALAN